MRIRLFGRKIGEVDKGWGLSLKICLFESGVSLHIMPIFGSFFISLPRATHRLPHEGMESWGATMRFECWNSDLHLNWGRRYKIIHFPWHAVHIRRSVLLNDGRWHTMGRHEYEKPKNAWAACYDYAYHTGHRLQEVSATVTVEEREWRPKLFKHFKWSAHVRRSIDVCFSDEIGAERGSWKGGCVGCGYEMQPGDTPLVTLRRMEFERRFR